MTGLPPERDDDRFQEVLGRLDALVRRGHPGDESPPPPPAVSEASIPVLTDVYLPDSEEGPNLSSAEMAPETLAQAVAEVLPGVMEVLEDVFAREIKLAMSEALDAAIADVRPLVEERLRQHLLQILTKGGWDQTEI